MNLVHSDTVFNVDQCDKQFSIKYNLNEHVKTSHGGETVNCCFCQDSYHAPIEVTSGAWGLNHQQGAHNHVQEYILTTGKGLGRVSDQIVEACHSALNKRLMKSNYWLKDVESSQHAMQ